METKTKFKKEGIKEKAKHGGIFFLDEKQLELIEGERLQIDEIIDYAKEDDVIKHYLFCKILEQPDMFAELEHHFADWFGSKGMTISDNTIESIIDTLEDVFNDNIQYDGGSIAVENGNLYAYTTIPQDKRKKQIENIKTLLIKEGKK